jgi:O-antigen ligase
VSAAFPARRLRPGVLAVAATVLMAGPFALAFFSGGFFDEPRLVAAIVAWALVAVAAVAAPRPLPRDPWARSALLGLALLLAWSAISLAWAPVSSAAHDDLQRITLYLGALTAAFGLLRSRAALRAIEPAVVAGSTLVVVYGMSDRLVPGLVTLSHSFTSGSRLEQPLTYWNAMGLLAAMGVVLAARVAGDAERRRAVRVLAAAAAAPLGMALYLSLSRGAIAAVGAGLVVLIAAAPTWTQLRAAAVTLEAGVLTAAVASVLPAVVSYNADDAARQAQGAFMLGVLVLSALAAGLLQAWACRLEDAGAVPMRRLPLPRRAPLYATAAVVLTAVAFVAVAAKERRTAEPFTGANPQRLASLQSNRYEYWRVALRTFAQHPLAGVGTAGFRAEWLRERPYNEEAKDAHSLYLETAAELGLVGLAALGLLCAGLGVSARRAMQRDPGAAAGLLAGLVVYAFHAGIDWDWEMPTVTLIALLLGAGLLVLADD